MPRLKSPAVVALTIILFSGMVYGQAWSGILDPSRAIDWSQAGASHINDTRTQCGPTISAYTGTASTINTAIANCGANQYVLLGPGAFSLSTTIVFQNTASNVTLRGSGGNTTIVTFTGTSSGYSYCANHEICAASSDTNNASGVSNSANWTAGYTRGATAITLSSVTNLKVGNPIILDQLDDSSDTGWLWVGCEVQNPKCGNDGPTSFQRLNRGQNQIVTVESCDGNATIGHPCSSGVNVTISPGLYASNWTSAKSPGAWWSTNPVQNVGVENLKMVTSTNSSGAVFFFNCQGCWVRGIAGVLTISPSASGWGQIVTSICNQCTVRDSYFWGNVNADNYVAAVDLASDLLVENNIMQYPGTIQFYNSDCEGCVSGYNYSAGTLYGDGTSNWMSAAAMFHSVSLFALTEGNIGGLFWADGYHGTHNFNTTFRNRFDGREPNGSVQTSSNTNSIQLAPGSRYFNLIGNVLGTSGYHGRYKTVSGSSDTSIIISGFFPGTGQGDPIVEPTTMYWGNWDSASNASRWCGNSSNPGWTTTCGSTSEVPSSGLPNGNSYANPVPSSTALPPSFYLAGKPTWWPSGKNWPPIGPDVTGGNVGQCSGGKFNSSEATSSAQCTGGTFSVTAAGKVTSNPAMDCYLSVMGGSPNGTGSPLPFDASQCYSSSGVEAPQNLQASPR